MSWDSKLSEWGIELEDVALALAESTMAREEIDAMQDEVVEYWKWEVENIGAPGQLGGVGAPVNHFNDGHWISPGHWDEPEDYRNSIQKEPVNFYGDQAPHGTVGSNDPKAGWLEYGSQHNPEYGYGARVMDHFGGRMIESDDYRGGFVVG